MFMFKIWTYTYDNGIIEEAACSSVGRFNVTKYVTQLYSYLKYEYMNMIWMKLKQPYVALYGASSWLNMLLYYDHVKGMKMWIRYESSWNSHMSLCMPLQVDRICHSTIFMFKIWCSWNSHMSLCMPLQVDRICCYTIFMLKVWKCGYDMKIVEEAVCLTLYGAPRWPNMSLNCVYT